MSVEIYLDESVPLAVALGLKRRGVTAISVHEVGNLGLSDCCVKYVAQTVSSLFLIDNCGNPRYSSGIVTGNDTRRGSLKLLNPQREFL